MNKLNMESKNIVEDNLIKIKELFPNAVSEERIDFDILKQELSEILIDDKKEKYQLTWPGKKEAIINANKRINKTLRPVKDKSLNFDDSKNIYIEGDNLEALKLLQESYLNKIKCIYIDPPYNTGNDFVYNDNFSKSASNELIESGQVDELGNRLVVNSQSNGRFHSDWLSMMYSRLKLARNLLSDDGLIFISIADEEVANLRKICDEIFGETAFQGQMVVKVNTKMQKYKPTIGTEHEYILCYAKSSNCTFNYVDNDNYKFLYDNYDEYSKLPSIPTTKKELNLYTKINIIYNENPGLKNYTHVDSKGLFRGDNLNMTHGKGGMFKLLEKKDGFELIPPKHGWCNKKRFLETGMFEECGDDIIFSNPENIEQIDGKKSYSFLYYDDKTITQSKTYLDKKTVFSSVISGFQGSDDLALQQLFGFKVFDFPKITGLIKKIVALSTNEDSIVLDFFSGSATTANAVLQLNKEDNGNRKFIMVQLPELTDEKSEAYKNGFHTICDIGEERIKKEIQLLDESKKLGFRVFKIDSSNMKDVFYKPSDVEQMNLLDYISNIKDDRSTDDLLTQVMLDLGLTLDLKIDEKTILNNKVYFVENNSLVACFDEQIDINIVDEICKCNPMKVVFKDTSFKTDKDKINLEEKIKKLSPDTEVSVL